MTNLHEKEEATNALTKQTLSADEIIGEIMNSNNTFIPLAVGPHGEFGSLFRQFLEADKTIDFLPFSPD